MGKIYRTNVFTGEREWADFEGGVEVVDSGWKVAKTYSTAWTRPHESQAAAVHSSQANEFNEDYKRHGITGAYHRADGVLVSNDQRSLNRVMQLRQLRDNDACYSQHAGS